jgi:hypothetical protein
VHDAEREAGGTSAGLCCMFAHARWHASAMAVFCACCSLKGASSRGCARCVCRLPPLLQEVTEGSSTSRGASPSATLNTRLVAQVRPRSSHSFVYFSAPVHCLSATPWAFAWRCCVVLRSSFPPTHVPLQRNQVVLIVGGLIRTLSSLFDPSSTVRAAMLASGLAVMVVGLAPLLFPRLMRLAFRVAGAVFILQAVVSAVLSIVLDVNLMNFPLEVNCQVFASLEERGAHCPVPCCSKRSRVVFGCCFFVVCRPCCSFSSSSL